jgi:hypothetical protein
MDSPLTLACALDVEARAARRAGARAAQIGLAASKPIPEGPLASFGLAGALVSDLELGALVTATKVVDEEGTVLWEGEPLPVPNAAPGVICSALAVVDEPEARSRLAHRTGAVAVELESRALAATGRLAGVVRAISDTPDRPVGRLARASSPDGSTAWGVVAQAFLLEPAQALRASLNARRALGELERAAAFFAQGAR